jgi:hypothetical protein
MRRVAAARSHLRRQRETNGDRYLGQPPEYPQTFE